MSESKSSDVPKVPIARVKRIIKQDDDVVSVSSGAVYAVAAATELFAHYFTEQAYLNAQSDKRKVLKYDDYATAVANVEQLEFLQDVVPKRIPYKKIVEKRKAAGQADKQQMTLTSVSGELGVKGPESVQNETEVEDQNETKEDEDDDENKTEDQDSSRASTIEQEDVNMGNT